MHGLVIKVSNDCNLGLIGGAITQPPALPGNNIGNKADRDRVEFYYYQEFAYESCDLNNAKDFNSKQDCEDAWRCLAQEYAKLIPAEDVKAMADEMEERGGETVSIEYNNEHPLIEQQIRSKYDLCLSGRHEDY
jgi:hypothetical protein